MKSNRLIKGILMITGGTALAQLLNVVLSPIITRLYSPQEYGMLTLYVAIIGMITIVGSLMYELAIPIAENDEVMINVIALSIIILVLISGLITFSLALVGDRVLLLFNAEVLESYKLLIPVGVFFTGLYTIFIQYAYRTKDFKSVGKTKVNQSISQGLIQIGFTFISSGPLGLIGGRIIGQSAGFITLGKPLFVHKKHMLKAVSVQGIVQCAKRYIKFPFYLMPSQFLNTASSHIPVVLLGSLFGGEVVGLFGLANSMVNLPMTLVGKSVADVFYSEAASIGRTNPVQLKKLSIKIFKKLFLIGLVPLVTLLLFGPFLFSFVFGVEWYWSGIFSRSIAIMVFARFIFTPVSKIYVVFERQRESLCLNILRVTLVLLTFIVSKSFELSPLITIFVYSLTMAVVYFVTFIGAQKIMEYEISSLDTSRGL